MQIIDVSKQVGGRAQDLAAAGVRTVFRYYTRDSEVSAEKRLHPTEAGQLAAAGIRIGAIYEGRHGNKVYYFDYATGQKDATFARTYANHAIGQPAGSAIYFAVDTDPTEAEVEHRIVPYFQAVAAAMKEDNGEPLYRVGVYASGAVCEELLASKLVQTTWVAQARKWRGSEEFRKSGHWTLDQSMPTFVSGIECDLDTASPGADIGDFQLPAHPLHAIASWLKAAAPAALLQSSPAAAPPANRFDDAVCIPRLIELGSTEAGLARARSAASSALAGYPHNGCAAHLCALLEEAGIDVKWTNSAGKLAYRLEQRGWVRIGIGEQKPGDVGVTIEKEPPDGADHIYLVIRVLTNNEMEIADNQNGHLNAPHRRFATAGHGKLKTDYFLRAV